MLAKLLEKEEETKQNGDKKGKPKSVVFTLLAEKGGSDAFYLHIDMEERVVERGRRRRRRSGRRLFIPPSVMII